jgi:phytoene desaturase
VKQVLVENGRAVGVELADGSTRRADVVICNADYPWAKKHLLKTAPKEVAALEKRRYTASGYMLYWGVKRRYEQLHQHNIIFGNDFEDSFKAIFDRGEVPADPSFYVNAPAHLDPSMAPEGKDAIYVLVPCPNTAATIDWAVKGPQVRAQVLARLAELGMPDLEKDIEVEKVYTPLDWRDELNLERGANFGLAQNLFQIGPFRPKVFDDQIQNLFYCGASVQPGTGVPTVMISAELMLQELAKRAHLDHTRHLPTLVPAPEGERA